MAVPHSLPPDWVVPDLNGRGNGPYGILHLLRWRIAERFKANVADPEGAQKCALDRVLNASQGTAFGASHDLRLVKTYREYCDAVPVRPSTEFEIWLKETEAGRERILTRHPVRSFVKTSGTTGEPKLLPVTDPWAKVVAEGQLLWTMGMVKEQEAVAWGKALTTLGQPVEGHAANGVPYGSNTGRMGAAQPWLVRNRWAIPPDVASLTEPDVRHYAWLRMALSARVTSWTTANPSMILALCRRLQEWRKYLEVDLKEGSLSQGPGSLVPADLVKRWRPWLKRREIPTDWSPVGLWNLAAVNCWTGGPAQYFVERLPHALGGSVTVRDVGITASEGYFAIPLHSSWRGGVAWTGGHFMELGTEDGSRVLPIYEGVPGQTYRLIISTTAGLYRYDIKDRVEVVGHYRASPVLRFVGKSSDVFSILGEKVTSDQVSAVLAMVLPADFGGEACVSVELGEIPRYLLCVEGVAPDEWACTFDAEMQLMNVEYASKRQSGRLGMPVGYVLPTGTFKRARVEKLNRGAADGQAKDSLLAPYELVQRWRRQD